MTSNQENQAHEAHQAHQNLIETVESPSCCHHHHHHHCDFTREPAVSREARERTLTSRIVNVLKDINRYLVCDIHKMECWLADEAEARANEAKQEARVYKLEPTITSP